MDEGHRGRRGTLCNLHQRHLLTTRTEEAVCLDASSAQYHS